MVNPQLPDPDEYIHQLMMGFRHYGFGSLSEEMAQKISDFVYYCKNLPVHTAMSEESKESARQIFSGQDPDRKACIHCAGLHYQLDGLSRFQQPCPRIKKIQRHTDQDTILEVEYWPNGEWEADVVFPGDVFE